MVDQKIIIESIEKALIKIWEIKLKPVIEQGYLQYERHLQAELYRRLVDSLTGLEVRIWAEPRLYLNNKDNRQIVPDLVITDKKEIIAAIEIKYKPWEYISNFEADIEKLNTLSSPDGKFVLGRIPVSSNWKVQKESRMNLEYTVSKNLLKVFISFERSDGNSIVKTDTYQNMNLLHLYGYLAEKGEVILESKKYSN